MRTLNLRLAPAPGAQEDDELVMPAEVRTADGALLSRVVLSSKRTLAVELPDQLDVAPEGSSVDALQGATRAPERIVVAARMPFGEEIRQEVRIGGPITDYAFELRSSAQEWLSWATTRLNLARTVDLSFDDAPAYKVWGKLWVLQWSTWRPRQFEPQDAHGDRYVRQFDILLEEPSLLQLGGPKFPIRFVSLPKGRVRVLLARNASTKPNAEPLKIVVSTGRAPNEEMLLSLLAADILLSADTLTRELARGFDWTTDAHRRDPVRGCALGYAALKLNSLDVFTVEQATAFLQTVPNCPDASILAASRQLADGTDDCTRVLALYDAGLGQALPVLAEAMRSAHEGLALLAQDPSAQLDRKLLATLSTRAGRYMSAKAWAGPFLSFYGAEPLSPSSLWRYCDSDFEIARDVSQVALSVGKQLLNQTGGLTGFMKRAAATVAFSLAAKVASKLLIESEPAEPPMVSASAAGHGNEPPRDGSAGPTSPSSLS